MHGVHDHRIVRQLKVRRHDQGQARKAALVLFLDHLIIEVRSAKPSGQHVLEDVLHVGPDQRHPFAGELAEAPDVADVRRDTQRAEPAAARAVLDDAEIVGLHIEEHLRRTG